MLQAPEDQKMNYGYEVLGGMFEKWIEAKQAQDSAAHAAAEGQTDSSQAAAPPYG